MSAATPRWRSRGRRQSRAPADVCSWRDRAIVKYACGQAPIVDVEAAVARPAQRRRTERADNLEVAVHREASGRRPSVLRQRIPEPRAKKELAVDGVIRAQPVRVVTVLVVGAPVGTKAAVQPLHGR